MSTDSPTSHVQGGFDRIVVGLDDHDPAMAQTIRQANLIARDFDAHVYAVHAIAPPGDESTTEMMPESYWQPIFAAAKDRLTREIASQPGVFPPAWQVLVGYGGTKEVILSAAREHHADLIVISSHGRQAWQLLFAPSLAQCLAMTAPCPVLALGPHFATDELSQGRILFATDFGPTAKAAAERAASLARRGNRELIAFHVLRHRRHQVEDRETAEKKLDELLPAASRDGLRYRTLIADGDPGEEIVAAASREHASLIVLGTGHHGEFSGQAPWRNFAHVIRSATCAVLNVGPASL